MYLGNLKIVKNNFDDFERIFLPLNAMQSDKYTSNINIVMIKIITIINNK